jgi:hypothetical protein
LRRKRSAIPAGPRGVIGRNIQGVKSGGQNVFRSRTQERSKRVELALVPRPCTRAPIAMRARGSVDRVRIASPSAYALSTMRSMASIRFRPVRSGFPLALMPPLLRFPPTRSSRTELRTARHRSWRISRGSACGIHALKARGGQLSPFPFRPRSPREASSERRSDRRTGSSRTRKKGALAAGHRSLRRKRCS